MVAPPSGAASEAAARAARLCPVVPAMPTDGPFGHHVAENHQRRFAQAALRVDEDVPPRHDVVVDPRQHLRHARRQRLPSARLLDGERLVVHHDRQVLRHVCGADADGALDPAGLHQVRVLPMPHHRDQQAHLPGRAGPGTSQQAKARRIDARVCACVRATCARRPALSLRSWLEATTKTRVAQTP